MSKPSQNEQEKQVTRNKQKKRLLAENHAIFVYYRNEA